MNSDNQTEIIENRLNNQASLIKLLDYLRIKNDGFEPSEEVKILSKFNDVDIPTEVLNFTINYTLITKNQSSLNKNYIFTLMNVWLQRKLIEAELAMQNGKESNCRIYNNTHLRRCNSEKSKNRKRIDFDSKEDKEVVIKQQTDSIIKRGTINSYTLKKALL